MSNATAPLGVEKAPRSAIFAAPDDRAPLEYVPARPTSVSFGRATRFGPIIGASSAMRLLFEQISRAAPTKLTVLITAETGCGKELVAQALHEAGPRKGRPFVTVDCGSIPGGLAESTLFGHERGAFTGAIDRRVSPFVEANGGTIFLDEIGDLPLELQPKLLRVLAERRVKAVGSNTYQDVDVRVVAATRRDLTAAVINEGAFRSDLFFRLAELRMHIPPLRERLGDVPLLIAGFLSDLGQPEGLAKIPQTAMDRLLQHGWPGNVRELKSVLKAAVALTLEGEALDPSEYLGPSSLEAHPHVEGLSFRDARGRVLARFEATYFSKLLAETNGNITEIARRTGLARIHVRKYVVRHALAPARPAAGGARKRSPTTERVDE